MKKTTFVALTLSAAIMVMGAGYAAWTESVTINNTVSTGNLSVQTLDGTVDVFQNATDIAEPAGIARTATAIANNTGDALETVTVTNLYPGAHVHVTVPVQNDGTIPVTIDSLASNNTNANVTVANVSGPTGNLDPGAEADITYTIDVLDSAPETTNISFDVTATANQFNQ